MFNRKQTRPSTPSRFSRPAAQRQAIVEACEPRRMYDATPSYSVSGTEGNDTIVVNVFKEGFNKYDVTTILNGKTTFLNDVKPGYLNVYGKGGNDKITLTGQFDTMAPQTVLGGEGNDTLTLKAAGNQTLRDRLSVGVTFDGGKGTDALKLDSAQQPDLPDLNLTYTVSDRTIELVKANGIAQTPAVFTSKNVEAQDIKTGGHSNTVAVLRTVIPTNVFGGSGDDTVFVGQNGITDGVQGHLYVSGGTGDDALTFDETGRSYDHSYEFDGQHFDTPTAPPVLFQNFDHVTLDAGKGSSVVRVKAVKPLATLELRGNGGDDIFILGDGHYDDVQASQVVVKGGAGKNHVLVNDGDDVAPFDWSVTDTKITRTNSIDYADQAQPDVIKMSDTYSVDLETGRGDDHVSVQMSKTTSFDVQGGGWPNEIVENWLAVSDGSGVQQVPVVTGVGAGYYTETGLRNVASGGIQHFTGDHKVGGAISGILFNDLNGDGKLNDTNGALANAAVYIDANHNNKYDSGEKQAYTNNDSQFSFFGLAPGTYYIGQRQPYGWRQTTPAGGGSMKVVVGAGGVTADRWIGVTRTGQVSGQVFVDKDKDNQRDGNEYGDSGWRVYDDADNDGKFDDTELSTLTASNGLYTLNGLAADKSHRLRVAPVSGHTPYFKGGQLIYTPAGGTYSGFDFSLLKNA